jgi:hypothetical protein
MLDRACGLRGTSAILNYDTSCGRCHIGKVLPFPDPATGQPSQPQLEGLDCLVCHATKYDVNNDGIRDATEVSDNKVRVADPVFGEVWFQDRSLEAAQSVGGPVGVHQCLRCHDHGLNSCSFKRGAPFSPERDVHAAAGFLCTRCHEVEDHKFARGSRVIDTNAWERPDVEVYCTNCHGAAPHESMPIYNDHAGKIACETCHIPHAAGVERQVWAPTLGVASGPEANIPIFDPLTGKYAPYIKYQPNVFSPPDYRWYGGQASMLAEPAAQAYAFDLKPATRETPGAKITPFRKIINGMVMDRRGIPSMPDFDPKFTMLAFMQGAQDFMIAAGFMRPEGLLPQEQAFLSQFPNLLLFDQKKYFDTGNIADAVDLGLGRFAAYGQGINPATMTEQQLMDMGAQMWSGEYTGLDLPDNPMAPGYINDSDPTTATGSFITLSHAVTKVDALRCADCHRENGRMDFGLLGYTPEKEDELATLLGDLSAFEGDLDQSGEVGPEDLILFQQYWQGSQEGLLKALQKK